MTDQTIVITGASDGIGAAAARALTAAGNQVVLVGRSPEKTQAVAAELGAPYHLADFADLGQVRRLAAELLEAYPRIDVLANNAGATMAEREVTVDGHEKTFQVDHLAPFLLTRLLIDRLVQCQAKVITTASAAHWTGRVRLDDLESEHGRYRSGRAYGTAKLENILFSAELHRRFHAEGLSTASFHPGVVASSFGRGSGAITRALYAWPLNVVMASNEQGADTLVWLAVTEPSTDWISGAYYAKRTLARSSSAARDPELARQLWDRSAALVAGV